MVRMRNSTTVGSLLWGDRFQLDPFAESFLSVVLLGQRSHRSPVMDAPNAASWQHGSI